MSAKKKQHKNRKFQKCHSELSITVKRCSYNMSRKSREFSRDIYVEKSRVFNVARTLQNLVKFYHFLAVYSDFGGFSGGTNCRAY